jgi:hypothetical protein
MRKNMQGNNDQALAEQFGQAIQIMMENLNS